MFKNGVVILKDASKNPDGSHDLHVVGSPTKEIQACIKCLSDNLPQDVKRISSHGGISPGGISAILRFQKCGWNLVGTESKKDSGKDNHYWSCSEPYIGRLKKWLDNPEHKNYWELTGEKKGDPREDTCPRVPIVERP